MMGAYGALGLNVCLLVLGQLCWKIGMDRLRTSAGALWQAAFSPLVWAGLVLYGLATVLWLFVLSRLPLSVAYPVQAIAYVLGLVMARIVLGDPVPPLAWLGSLLVLLGVGLIAYRPLAGT